MVFTPDSSTTWVSFFFLMTSPGIYLVLRTGDLLLLHGS